MQESESVGLTLRERNRQLLAENERQQRQMADLVLQSDIHLNTAHTVAAERNALRAENERLRAALEWYADAKNWDGEGAAIDNVTGGYQCGDEFVDIDYDWDKGARARDALGNVA